MWLAERPLGVVYRRVPFQAISESTADDLAERGIPRGSVRVIYPGIDTVAYTPNAAERAPRPVFSYLGRLKKYKGVHLVIRAFAAMAVPDATLEIAGAGDYRPELEALARSLDLGGRVRFLGRISEAEKLSLLRRSWALVFASPKEGWGITNLEAAACGTPVVASNSPGIRESVRDGQTGFLVAHGDVSAMAAAMRRLAESRELVASLGVAARTFAESFTWERAAEQTERHHLARHCGGRPRHDVPKTTHGRRLIERMREALQLDHVEGTDGLDRVIENPDVSSPGLAVAGYVERFPATRLQVLGETEVMYLRSLDPTLRRRQLEAFFSFPIPCVFITKGQTPLPDLVELAARAGIGLITSKLKTNEFYTRIKPWLEEEFAPTTNLHGSLADVFGVGLLFVGKSGIGKSECVLDLVERGHRLVADDLVIARRRGTDLVIGRPHERQHHHMEIRGVGLVDIKSIFGIRSVRQQKRIEVVVQLEEWDQSSAIERTGLDTESTTILEVELPKVRVPLNPGKNITVIAEVIAMNHLLKYSGVDPAERFNERLIGRMQAAADVRQYLQDDDE